MKKLYGLELTEHQIERTVSSIERDGMLERIQDPRSGMGSKNADHSESTEASANTG